MGVESTLALPLRGMEKKTFLMGCTMAEPELCLNEKAVQARF